LVVPDNELLEVIDLRAWIIIRVKT
jgi:hypothetical protein